MNGERGPLDELFPGARALRPVPRAPVHPRVLEVRDAPDVASFVLVVWPEADRGVELQIKRVVEATLLAELSRTPSDLHADGMRRVGSLRMVSFVPLEADAIAPLGFRATERDESWNEALAHVRGEASTGGREPPETAPQLWVAPFAIPSEAAMALERSLRAVGDEARFGARPGELTRSVAAAIGLPPEALDAFAAALVPETVGDVRWVEPMLFQALCDAVGVYAARVLGLPVQWAVGEPDDEGLEPPPLLRAREAHVPVGLELLRWCVMPLRPGEEVPDLSAWCRDRFGAD